MARRKTALLMTIGTGTGEDKIKSAKSLAHGLLFSIDSQNPDEIYFFGSKDSLPTLGFLKEQYKEKFGSELDFYEFIEIDRVDSFEKYFNGFKNKIEELEGYKVIIDYTSGTKTMTMSAAFASMIQHKNLIFVSGKRENGIVVRGTEKIISQNLYPVYDELMFEKLNELFNSNRFESGEIFLDDIVGDNPDKEIYSRLFKIYNCFDIFDYKTAYELFDEEFINQIRDRWPEKAHEFTNNRRALTSMQKLDPEIVDLGKKPWKNKKYKNRCYYILANLLNNAKRRFEEHKYDDAIARLYRSFEFIAQIELKTKYGLVTSNVDVEILKNRHVNDEYIEKLENSRDEESGVIKIGLVQDYELLNALSSDLGCFYKENENIIRNSTIHRNSSILAHGFNFSSKTDYEEFEEIVLKSANILNSNMARFIEESKFPNLN